jgi:hypothetical protein
MTERVVLHVGTHKTGSTSIQQFLQDHDETLLAAAGVHYPDGFLIPSLHSDLPLLAIRPDRTWPARIRFPETLRPSWQAAAAAHVRAQVTSSSTAALVYSHEDLSYVRFDDELERLRDLFEGCRVEVVVYLREPATFLHSYRTQLETSGFELSDDPSSFAYVEADSWLVDHDALVACYGRAFGERHVRVLDYDEAVRADGSVIPSFAAALGIDRRALPSLDAYFLNRAGSRLRPTPEQLAAIRQRLADQAR